MTAPICWRPNLTAAVDAALAAAGLDHANFADHPFLLKKFEEDARAVLDASGATDEIMRLRAVLHAATTTLRTLREENEQLLRIAMPMLLGPVLADQPETMAPLGSAFELIPEQVRRDAAERDGFPGSPHPNSEANQ